MKNKTLKFILISILGLSIVACDDMLSDNLVVLDSVTSANYSIDTGEVTFSENESVNLQSVIDDIDGDVKNVDFFNITMFVSNIYNSSPQTSITGELTSRISGSSDTRTLVNFTDISFDEFLSERSIFSDELPGITHNPDGIQALIGYYNRKPAPVVNFTVNGTINRAGGEDNVKFDFVVKLYTQISTDP